MLKPSYSQLATCSRAALRMSMMLSTSAAAAESRVISFRRASSRWRVDMPAIVPTKRPSASANSPARALESSQIERCSGAVSCRGMSLDHLGERNLSFMFDSISLSGKPQDSRRVPQESAVGECRVSPGKCQGVCAGIWQQGGRRSRAGRRSDVCVRQAGWRRQNAVVEFRRGYEPT